MDYSNHDIADLAADRSFVSWVLSPDEHSDRFWNQWSADHPEKSKILYEARLLVLLMNSRRLKMSDENKENLWNSIQSRSFEDETRSQAPAQAEENFWIKKHWIK